MTTVEKIRPTQTEAAQIMPFGGWETTPHADEAFFRFPAAEDPAPANSRLLGTALYATALGLAGVGIGVRALFSAVGGTVGWYLPVLALLGLLSIASVVGAFLSIHRRALPWALLLAANIPMAAAAVVAVRY